MRQKRGKFNQARWLGITHDMLWIPLALYFSYWAHFNFRHMVATDFESLLTLLPLALVIQTTAFFVFGLHRGIWRFASVSDLSRIIKAVLTGTAVIASVIYLLRLGFTIPRTSMVLYPVFLIMGLTAPRLAFRWFGERKLGLSRADAKRTLILGAGRSGDRLIRDLQKDAHYQPIGLLDDAEDKWGRELQGVRILGPLQNLSELLDQGAVDLVLIAMPSAGSEVIRQAAETCREKSVHCATLPAIHELDRQTSSIKQVRSIRIEDLLGRDPVKLEHACLHTLLEGKRILITGAGGSIGSELCRQACAHQPEKLVAVEHSEHNLYTLESSLAKLLPEDRYKAVIADVRDRNHMEKIFAAFKPEIVLHAAAYKHVPIVERNPAEGVNTNLLGTRVVADLASEYGAEKFLLVSTDKAVNPGNVMGASKRSAEIYCQWLQQRSKTSYIVTRFGNVLGSAGSVVPLFRQQIEAGGPVTVTHPEVTRFFMTIGEAVSLILQAAAMGKGGEIFVLDMGEPMKIVDLAQEMIRLYDPHNTANIEIEFTGLRPGEKLYEELFHQAESLLGTDHPKILQARCRNNDHLDIPQLMLQLQTACTQHDEAAVKHLMARMVPEFKPQPYKPHLVTSDALDPPHPGQTA